jgi:hypothetical protein
MAGDPFPKKTYSELREVDLLNYRADSSFETRSPIDVLAKKLMTLCWHGKEFHPRLLSPGYSHEEYLERCMIHSEPPFIPEEDEILDDKRGSLVIIYKFTQPLRHALFYGVPDCVDVNSTSGLGSSKSGLSDHASITFSWLICHRQEALEELMEKVFHPMFNHRYGLKKLMTSA